MSDATITLLIGVLDTTSNTMCSLLYCVDQHNDEFNLLIDTLKSDDIGKKLIDKNYPLVNYNEINNMEYLHWFVQETMRLYPTATNLTRLSTKENELDGVIVPQGTYIL